MTYNVKITTIVLAIFVIGIPIQAVFAHAPPYIDNYWFNFSGDPEVCYLETELDALNIVNGDADDVITAIDTSRSHYNSKINDLTINAEDSNCSYNRIVIGTASYGWNVGAGTMLTAYWCCSNFGQYAEMEINFNTDKNWQVNSKKCGFFDNKDPRYIANHEFGHALSLDHHSGANHSVMNSFCSQKYNAIQSVDEIALEVRYS